MPTSRAITTEIQNLLDHLMNSEIALFVNPVLDQGGLVSWRSTGGSVLSKRGFPTLHDYRDWVEAGAYSAVLFDGSLLQLTYHFAGTNILVGHRLAYVPCPFNADHELLRLLPIVDVIDYYAANGADDVILRSTVRFDFDIENQRPGHPAAHLTFNSGSCRVACTAPLRLGRFLEFVFRHFYPDVWARDRYLPRVSKKEFGSRTITAEETSGPHVAWRT
jgi:hypothetical protein